MSKCTDGGIDLESKGTRVLGASERHMGRVYPDGCCVLIGHGTPPRHGARSVFVRTSSGAKPGTATLNPRYAYLRRRESRVWLSLVGSIRFMRLGGKKGGSRIKDGTGVL